MSTDAIDDPVEELLRQDLAEARRQERDGHRHQVDPYRAAQLKQEAWEAWQPSNPTKMISSIRPVPHA